MYEIVYCTHLLEYVETIPYIDGLGNDTKIPHDMPL